MSTRRLITLAGLAAVAASLAVLLWFAGVIAAGQYSEDICFDDLSGRASYGAYRTEVTAWPPSFECVLLGDDVPPITVQHRRVAIGTFVAWYLMPIIYAVATLGSLRFWARRTRHEPLVVA